MRLPSILLGSSQLGKDNAPGWALRLAGAGGPQFWLPLGWYMAALCLLASLGWKYPPLVSKP